jgi:hypothetical protein
MKFHAYGLPGVGDIMGFLNTAHVKAHANLTKCELVIHWPHDEDFLYAHDDIETIVERCDYIHNFYIDQHMVKITHIFNDHSDFLRKYYIVTDEQYKTSYVEQGEGIYDDGQKRSRSWFMRNPHETIRDKVVIWRPTFNAETPRRWKMALNNDDWDSIIQSLRDQGCDVVELCYRTPIREAFYHIATSDYNIFYDGMWHFMSVNLFKPSIVVTLSSIGLYNSVNAVAIRSSNGARWVHEKWNRPCPKLFVEKCIGDTDDVKIVDRYTYRDISVRVWMRQYNRKIERKFKQAYKHHVDWTIVDLVDNDSI